jgi:hypothetical protein
MQNLNSDGLRALALNRRLGLAFSLGVFVVLAQVTSQAGDWTFSVRRSSAIAPEPFSGRVYIFFSRNESTEPRKVFRFLRSEPIIAQDVVAWRPGETITFSRASLERLLTFPNHFSDVDLTGYRAQAVVRLNTFAAEPGNGSPTGEGDAYSDVITMPGASRAAPILLTVDRVVPPVAVQTTKWRQLIEVRSSRLSAFHHRDIKINAAAVLPFSYFDRPRQRYPVVFDIPSFGGAHHFPRPNKTKNDRRVDFIQVELDASCPLGHHAFADSANNGPYGTALVEEFLPAFDARFRTIPRPTARFLTGISSGGWSSLWVQVTHPDLFNGCWSDAPDPVDFRDFQQIDLYSAGENLFKDRKGHRRPLARNATGTLIWFDELSRLEQVLGEGGQLHSFEAVFSHRDGRGHPSQLWDRTTGEIDREVAREWEQFDIRLVLESRWKELGPKLVGKLHIDVDEQDTFFLEGAVKRLKKTLERLKSDAVVTVHPGFGHARFATESFLRQMANEMADRFLASHPDFRQSAEPIKGN